MAAAAERASEVSGYNAEEEEGGGGVFVLAKVNSLPYKHSSPPLGGFSDADKHGHRNKGLINFCCRLGR